MRKHSSPTNRVSETIGVLIRAFESGLAFAFPSESFLRRRTSIKAFERAQAVLGFHQMAKHNLEVELVHILRDIKGLSPKTSTYLRLKQREKVLRRELRDVDKSYVPMCNIDECYNLAQFKFFDGTNRYHGRCKTHRNPVVAALA